MGFKYHSPLDQPPRIFVITDIFLYDEFLQIVIELVTFSELEDDLINRLLL